MKFDIDIVRSQGPQSRKMHTKDLGVSTRVLTYRCTQLARCRSSCPGGKRPPIKSIEIQLASFGLVKFQSGTSVSVHLLQ